LNLIKITTAEGIVFEVPTVEDAAKLYALLGGKVKLRKNIRNESDSELFSKKRVPSVLKLNAEMTPLAKQAVTAILENPDGLTTESLAKEIEIEPKNLPPLLRGVKRASKISGFVESVLVREGYSEEGKPKSLYKISQEYLDAFERIPQEEEGEEQRKSSDQV
jgi:hypothetical protein